MTKAQIRYLNTLLIKIRQEVLEAENAEMRLSVKEAANFIDYIDRVLNASKGVDHLAAKIKGPAGETFEFFQLYEKAKDWKNEKYARYFQEVVDFAARYHMKVSVDQWVSKYVITFETPYYIKPDGTKHTEVVTIHEDETHRNIKWRKWMDTGVLILDNIKRKVEHKRANALFYSDKDNSSARQAKLDHQAAIDSLYVIVK